MSLSKEDVEEIKNIIHEGTLEKQEGNQISLKTIYEKFSIYGLLFILILGLLDYFTLTDIFNFKTSSFLDIYLFNTSIFNSGFLLIVIFFPLILMSLIFLMPYLAILSSIRISEKINIKLNKFLFIPIICIKRNTYACPIQSPFENDNYKKIYRAVYSFFIGFKYHGFLDAIRLSILFNVVLISLSLYVFYKIGSDFKDIWKYILGIFIPIFFGFITVMPYVKYRNDLAKNSDFLSLFVLFNPFFFFILSFIPFLGFSDEYKPLVGIMLVLMTIPLAISIQVVDFVSEKTNNKKEYKISPLTFAGILISLIVAGTGKLNSINQEVWQDSNLSNNDLSMNLFLNKHFLTSNVRRIDINISNIIIPKHFNFDKAKFTNEFNETAHYLPISKEVALYFIDMNKSRSIIFAVNKSDDKYKILDIGFIDKKSKGKKNP